MPHTAEGVTPPEVRKMAEQTDASPPYRLSAPISFAASVRKDARDASRL